MSAFACQRKWQLLFVSNETNNFIIFTLSLILILLLLPKNVTKIKIKQINLLALSVALIILISFIKLPLNFQHFFIVAILLFTLSRLIKDTAFYEKEIVLIFIATLFFYLIFLLIYSFMPPIWLSVQMVAKFLSKNMASLINKKALFSATTIGLPVAVLFVIVILIYHIHSKARSIKLLITGLISILIAQALSIPSQIFTVSFFKKL
ncbi:MAG: hypothetical protein ONB16_12655, partial [candidate division KSB1 bacterium]|nr:hypothetical protein [candidate division KSB1 bacterium]